MLKRLILPFKKSLKIVLVTVTVAVLLVLVGATTYSYLIFPNYIGKTPPPPPSIPTGTSVEVAGRKIHYIKEGEGKPLILIHGFGGSTFSWRHNINPLSKTFTVYTLDLPGFGLSEKSTTFRYSTLAHAELVKNFMKALRIDKATLVGHSMGGEVAIIVALQYPEKVEKLILIDSPIEQSYPHPLMRLLASPPLGKVLVRSILFNAKSVEFALKRSYYDNKLVTKEVITGYFYPMRTKGADEAFLAMSRSYIITEVKDGLQYLYLPALIIWGEKDRLVLVDRGHFLHGQIRKSKLIIIPECGHSPMEEKPARINDLIERFATGKTLE
ncbi:MAG: alpha/beta hydrolase [Actinomycetota bacterium]|nr:alpha/beta hydrolase [Actinomycetota bacterium]